MASRVIAPHSDGLRPSLSELIALRDRVRGWLPAHRGAASVTGPGASMFRGRGMEYAESRPYTAGDDARHIDWRLSARTGKPHTKLFQAERERITLIVADTAPALYFGTRVRFKSVQAARAGAIAAWAAQHRGDRVGALRGSRTEPPVAPDGGSRGVLRVLDALVRWYAQPPAQGGGLDDALATSSRLLHPGASLVVLADASSLAAVGDGRLAGLARHHDLMVVLVSDPLELHPPRERLAFASDGAPFELDLDGPIARMRWRQAFADVVQQQKQRLQLMGARVRPIRGDDGDDVLLAALLDPRRVAA